MGVKGKLTASIEVECGGHLFHDLYQKNPHQISNVSPNNVNHFEIHEGETVKVGSIVSWKYNEDGTNKIVKEVIEAIDLEKKSITWKVIEGDLLELYNSFSIITSFEDLWATCTLVYEKKTEDTPEPLVTLGFMINLYKDMEGHFLN
ncbi:hypothetical protein CQW23_26616 [Capsicum baccatum]|uniref:Bet v I/Major latex protein domain-containing protein n=1 Tax=Capsicum baccatum TaxID=33114 RepID=A0A2G2VPC6_CAPBA|nr:hypothetical protein CQW23_26616 [Capsicum baccatum]